MYARIKQAVAWVPPELRKISIINPSEKLAKINPDLFPFTGYSMINNRYGNGIMNPKKVILLKITICAVNNKINRKILDNKVLFIFIKFF